MKFSDIKYERPDIEVSGRGIKKLIKELEVSKTVEEHLNIINQIYEIFNGIESMRSVVFINNMIDINNSSFSAEKEYINTVGPILKALKIDLYRVIDNSFCKNELKNILGEQYFKIIGSSLDTISDKVIRYIKEENNLCGNYAKIIANGKIKMFGKEFLLSEANKFHVNKNRILRKLSYEAKYDFFRNNEENIDKIYDKLIYIRDIMSKELGYINYTDLSYNKLNRTDYNSSDIKLFRDFIKKYIVPLTVELRTKQSVRLGVENIKYYDEKITYKYGNPELKVKKERFLNTLDSVFESLSKEIKEVFSDIKENEFMDLDIKKGKTPGGYCIYIDKRFPPYIIANLDGTAYDVELFMHEFGHSVQRCFSKKFLLPEYNLPTLELGEIPSMAMELLIWPYIDLFFGIDADKYRYHYLSQVVFFIPYCAAIDEFQHFIYENPNISIEARKIKWRELEEVYMPYKDYESNRYLNAGSIWHMQGHIFFSPFYYIDLEATFMRMKDDHMQNGQLKPAYNVQIAVENYFVIHTYISNDRTDYNTLIRVLEKHKENLNKFPEEVIADSGYSSEPNLVYLKNNNIASYIKLQEHEKIKKRSYKNDIGKFYNMEKIITDKGVCFICKNGRKLEYQRCEYRNKDGYRRNYEVYSCNDCSECEFKPKCLYKYNEEKDINKNKIMKVNLLWESLKSESHENIQSKKGIIYRHIRSIQTEGHFGDIKENENFRRFNHRSSEKVYKEFLLYAVGRNLNKYHRFANNKIKEYEPKTA